MMKLKSCPFCGDPTPIVRQQKSIPQFWLVGCTTCQASGPLMGRREGAVQAWNVRVFW